MDRLICMLLFSLCAISILSGRCNFIATILQIKIGCIMSWFCLENKKSFFKDEEVKSHKNQAQ